MDSILRPQAVTEKIEELNRLTKQYPDYLPIEVVANFFRAKPDGIRAYIDNSPRPFGISWQRMGKVNRAYKIPTAMFYLWYTGAAGYREEA